MAAARSSQLAALASRISSHSSLLTPHCQQLSSSVVVRSSMTTQSLEDTSNSNKEEKPPKIDPITAVQDSIGA